MNNSIKSLPVFAFHEPNQDMDSAVDMYIYGAIPDIDWNTWEEVNTDRDFVREFKSLERQYSRINIHINSPGGFIDQGLAIYNTIRNSKRETHTYNDGFCASMGAEILFSGDQVHVAKSSMTMLHSGWGIAIGNSTELREQADQLEKWDQVLAEVVAKRLDISVEDAIARYFDGKDHYLTGAELIEMGLADVEEEYEAENLPDNLQNLTPQQVFNHYSNNNNTQAITMDLKDFVQGVFKPGAKVQASVEEMTDLKNQAAEALNRIETLEAENKTLSSSKSGLETQVKDLSKEVATLTTAKAAVDQELATLKEETSAQHTPPQGGDNEQDDKKAADEEKADWDKEADAIQAQAHAQWQKFNNLKGARL